MSDPQLDVFRRLCAPFPAKAIFEVQRGGPRPFKYIKAQALLNRLDEVLGPWGWTIEYRETVRGFTARLGIQLLDGTWIYKEDGAGVEDMTRKSAGQQVEDTDNNAKSAYTNAFRRVAQNAWGLGRNLYGQGSPDWLQTQASPAPTVPTTNPTNGDGHVRRPPEHINRVPKPGKGFYCWLMVLQDHYGVELVKKTLATGKKLGYPERTDEWSQVQINKVALAMTAFIKTLDFYRGELDDLQLPSDIEHDLTDDSGDPSDERILQAAAIKEASSPEALRGLKTAYVAKVKTFLEHIHSREPLAAEVQQACDWFSWEVSNSEGVKGVVMQSIRGCTDLVWLTNCYNIACQYCLNEQQKASQKQALEPVTTPATEEAAS